MRFIFLATFLLPLISAIPQNQEATAINKKASKQSVGIGATVYGFWKETVTDNCFEDDTCRGKGVDGLNQGKKAAKSPADITTVSAAPAATSAVAAPAAGGYAGYGY